MRLMELDLLVCFPQSKESLGKGDPCTGTRLSAIHPPFPAISGQSPMVIVHRWDRCIGEEATGRALMTLLRPFPRGAALLHDRALSGSNGFARDCFASSGPRAPCFVPLTPTSTDFATKQLIFSPNVDSAMLLQQNSSMGWTSFSLRLIWRSKNGLHSLNFLTNDAAPNINIIQSSNANVLQERRENIMVCMFSDYGEYSEWMM